MIQVNLKILLKYNRNKGVTKLSNLSLNLIRLKFSLERNSNSLTFYILSVLYCKYKLSKSSFFINLSTKYPIIITPGKSIINLARVKV